MKNITLMADEKLIEAARERAGRATTLNGQFRQWSANVVDSPPQEERP